MFICSALILTLKTAVLSWTTRCFLPKLFTLDISILNGTLFLYLQDQIFYLLYCESSNGNIITYSLHDWNGSGAVKQEQNKIILQLTSLLIFPIRFVPEKQEYGKPALFWNPY